MIHASIMMQNDQNTTCTSKHINTHTKAQPNCKNNPIHSHFTTHNPLCYNLFVSLFSCEHILLGREV